MLPVRYGAVVPDAAAIEQFLQRHEGELSRQLARLRGTTEMGLRLTLANGLVQGSAQATTKSRRLHVCGKIFGRAAPFTRGADRWTDLSQETVERCTTLLDGPFLEFRRREPEPPGVLRVTFLVKRELAEQFAQRVRSFRFPTVVSSTTLLGPWPPYSFV